jgi:hypothetical protein
MLTFMDRGMSLGQRGWTPKAVNLSFLDRRRYLFFHVAPQLSSQLWPLDHEGGHILDDSTLNIVVILLNYFLILIILFHLILNMKMYSRFMRYIAALKLFYCFLSIIEFSINHSNKSVLHILEVHHTTAIINLITTENYAACSFWKLIANKGYEVEYEYLWWKHTFHFKFAQLQLS